MDCDSPQLLLFPGKEAVIEPCGLCFSCTKLKLDADRQRRMYWVSKKRRQAHATA